tara:strand:- start:262 stop:396 length:135 start_codon:yes stop_codon:yes gene_type:complete
VQADEIVVLEKGKLVEIGSQLNLLQQKGCYHAFWQQQIPQNSRD